MINLLTDKLPYSVNVGGLEYPIDPTASCVLKMSLPLFYKNNIPDDVLKAVNVFTEFLEYGGAASTDPTDADDNGVPMAGVLKRAPESNSPPEFSFEYDNAMIYAAFVQQYGIKDPGALHWFTFSALFAALNEECLFIKAVGYRSAKVLPNMSKEEKARIRKLKRAFKLPDRRTQAECDAALGAAFAH